MSHKRRTPTAAPVEDLLAKAGEKATAIGQEIKTAAAAKIDEVMHGAQGQIQAYSTEVWKDIQESGAFKDAIEYTRAKPLTALLLSIGLGILIGRGMRR